MKSKSLVFWLIILLAFGLRIYRLAQFPPGLYSDETAYGYNAYSLLKTGRDEYGKLWPLTFKSFGDYKPPMTAWLTIPFIAIFGLNEFAVRLPSALAGTFTVAIIYFLAKEIFPSKKLEIGNWKLGVEEIASLLLVISPWHLHFSRSSMLVGIEVMFISLGLLLFLKSIRQPRVLYFSITSFVAAIYTYYGSRITVALLLLTLTIIFRRELWRMRQPVAKSALLGLLFITPLVISIAKDPATLTGRARTISVFYSPGVRAQLWQAHTDDGPDFPAFWSRFFHNKPYYYLRDISRRYFQHLSYDFWVRTGDTTPPFDIPNMGVVYLADIIFVFYGVWLAFRYRTPKSLALLAYLFISPIVAALTFITPAANRSFNMVIGWTILTAVGIVGLMQKITQKLKSITPRPKVILYSLFSILYSLSFIYYLYQYYIVTPQIMAYKWHYGRKELVNKISVLEDQYDEVVFSNREGPAYIWLLFYKQYDPRKYWQTVKIDEQLDELGWLHVERFDKYSFPRKFNWREILRERSRGETTPQKVLFVGYEAEEIPEANDFWRITIPPSYQLLKNDPKYKHGISVWTEEVETILYPNGQVAFELVELTNDISEFEDEQKAQ